MSRAMKQYLRSAATGIVVCAVVFAFAISGVRIFGLQVYGVLTGSMEPAYPIGSLVYVKRVDPSTLRVNDVITFSMGRGMVATHRIVERVPDPDNPYAVSFRTKGDANDMVDNSLVTQANIVGKVVFSLPVLGYVASYIQSPPGSYIAILLGLALIAFVFLTDNMEEPAVKKRKKGKRRPAAQRARQGAGAGRKTNAAQQRSSRPQTRSIGYVPGEEETPCPQQPRRQDHADPPCRYPPQSGYPYAAKPQNRGYAPDNGRSSYTPQSMNPGYGPTQNGYARQVGSPHGTQRQDDFAGYAPGGRYGAYPSQPIHQGYAPRRPEHHSQGEETYASSQPSIHSAYRVPDHSDSAYRNGNHGVSDRYRSDGEHIHRGQGTDQPR